jgi:hypothetical protein
MSVPRLSRQFLEEQLAKLTPASYNPYYWHRRYKTKEELSSKHPLYERIVHGDFEPSEYYYQAEHETYLLEDKLKTCKNLEQEHDARQLFMERRRKLLEDYEKEENKRVQKLKTAFRNTFSIDKEQLESIMENFDGSLLDLYHYLKNKKYEQ